MSCQAGSSFTRNAMTPDDAIAKLKEVPCPSCLTLGSLVIMICGPGRGDCEWVGHCPTCGYKFDVEFAAAALDRLKREARVGERVDPCPACGAHDPEIHFACDTRKHTCFFVATCHACEHTFRIPVRTEDPQRPGIEMRGPAHS